jgi:hypothetical protein
MKLLTLAGVRPNFEKTRKRKTSSPAEGERGDKMWLTLGFEEASAPAFVDLVFVFPHLLGDDLRDK